MTASAPSAEALLSRPQSAALLGISLRTFDAHVRHKVPAVRIGGRVLFAREDLLQWLDTRKAGGSGGRKVVRRTASISVPAVNASNDPRAAAILSRLRGPACRRI